jgi:hypothetical protein
MIALLMKSSLPEPWYLEGQSSEDSMVSYAPMGATTARSRVAPRRIAIWYSVRSKVRLKENQSY